MKKTFSVFLLFSLLQIVFACKGNSVFASYTNNPDPTDTVPYIINEETFSSFVDSLSSSPSYDLYCEWDTENIHYSKFNVASLKDSTIKLTLCDNNSCGYVQPFLGNITCPFGPHRRYFHYGVDIDLETGDAVKAAFDGKVRIAKKSKSYGNVVVIRHSNGLETYYAHLSKLKVEAGQQVSAGDIIGLGGNTGYSRGSHLHFEVRYLGQPVNPSDIISFTEHKLITDTLCISKKTFNYSSVAKKVNKTATGKMVAVANGGKVLSGNLYVVKQGDNLFTIAKRYGTTVNALCAKNGLKTSSVLHLGQRIKL